MTLKTSHRDIGRPLDAPLLTFDLPALLEKIKSEEGWGKHERNAMTLHKSPGLRIVLVAMHAGTAIPAHKADYPFSLQVIEGSVQFTSGKKTTKLQRGQMLTLHAGIPHDIAAPEETAFLLTLAAGDAHPAQSSGH
ncbi:MAG: cupin domain-containing protein [Elusimicrobia bacterium]|nr:cupin domain-containing protein [Elusimicrobiota bacterium]